MITALACGISSRPVSERRLALLPNVAAIRALVVGLELGAWRAVFLQFALNGGDAGRFVRVNAHKDVATAQVVEVVGEYADTVVNALGVPTLLELYAVGLNLLLIQQVSYVDR